MYLDEQHREVWLCGRGTCWESYAGPPAEEEEDIPLPAEWDVPLKAVSS